MHERHVGTSPAIASERRAHVLRAAHGHALINAKYARGTDRLSDAEPPCMSRLGARENLTVTLSAFKRSLASKEPPVGSTWARRSLAMAGLVPT